MFAIFGSLILFTSSKKVDAYTPNQSTGYDVYRDAIESFANLNQNTLFYTMSSLNDLNNKYLTLFNDSNIGYTLEHFNNYHYGTSFRSTTIYGSSYSMVLSGSFTGGSQLVMIKNNTNYDLDFAFGNYINTNYLEISYGGSTYDFSGGLYSSTTRINANTNSYQFYTLDALPLIDDIFRYGGFKYYSNLDELGHELDAVFDFSLYVKDSSGNTIFNESTDLSGFEFYVLDINTLDAIYDYSSFDSISSYEQGHKDGYKTGLEDGAYSTFKNDYNGLTYNAIVDNTTNSVIDNIYQGKTYNQIFDSGESKGYNEGQASVSSANSTIMGLFGAIANVPITILNGLFPVEILNVPIITIILTLLSVVLLIWMIKKLL